MIAPAKEISVEVRVRYSETDQMGVAYHAHYLQWAEIGRTELLRLHGIRYRELEERGCLLVVADAHLRIVRSARYDDLLRITAWVTAVASRKVAFAYRIERADDGQILATVETDLMSVAADGRTARLPDDALASLRALVVAPAP